MTDVGRITPRGGSIPTELAVVDHMVSRFLAWRLPESFNPDNGISFKPTFNDHMDPPMRCNPTGTNLFDRTQAEAMVRHLLEGTDMVLVPRAPTEAIIAAGEKAAWDDQNAMPAIRSMPKAWAAMLHAAEMGK